MRGGEQDNGKSAEEIRRDLMAALKDFSGVYSENARKITESMQALRDKAAADAEKIREAFGAIRQKWQPFLSEVTKHQEAKSALRDNAGLLPHVTTPWELFNHQEPEKFGRLALDYYAKSWPTVEDMFRADLEVYDISDEAKQAFQEALICHRHELYRSVVLTLFPYVEMEFRKAFSIEVGGNAASLVELRKVIWESPAGVILNHVAPVDLLQIVDSHLYEKVRTTDDLLRFEGDAIPNRHAAIHGLIEYKALENSLNLLIVADYVFFLISQLRKYSGE